MSEGTIVRFTEPLSDFEQVARYVILEMQGDRALVQSLTHYTEWTIRPVQCYRLADLTPATQEA